MEYAQQGAKNRVVGVIENDVICAILTLNMYRKGILMSDDQSYLESIPIMNEKLTEGINTPLSECISLQDVRSGRIKAFGALAHRANPALWA